MRRSEDLRISPSPRSELARSRSGPRPPSSTSPRPARRSRPPRRLVHDAAVRVAVRPVPSWARTSGARRLGGRGGRPPGESTCVARLRRRPASLASRSGLGSAAASGAATTSSRATRSVAVDAAGHDRGATPPSWHRASSARRCRSSDARLGVSGTRAFFLFLGPRVGSAIDFTAGAIRCARACAWSRSARRDSSAHDRRHPRGSLGVTSTTQVA